MTHEAALTKAIMPMLKADTDIAAIGSVFNLIANANNAGAFLLFTARGETRERGFGGEICKRIAFDIKAVWRDAGGSDYDTGDALLQRAQFLLDGGRSKTDFYRVKDALNVLLDPMGFYLMGCIQFTSIPLGKQAIAPDLTEMRYYRGFNYLATLRQA